MVDTSSTSLADLIATTTERESLVQAGRSVLWCTPGAAKSLFNIISRRDKKFKGLIFQAVRLVRAMTLADAGGLVGFLYMNRRLPVLRTRLFKASFEHAVSTGRLAGVAEIGEDGESLHFLEPEMAGKSGKPFDIAFVQMPLIAALVDVAYLGITPDRFLQICAPVMSPKPQARAATVGTALTDILLEWIKPCLESDHFARQAGVMHGFCKERNIDEPELIDDQAVFDFWEQNCLDPKMDGFRQYINAAHKIVAYRRKWFDHRQGRNIRQPLHFAAGDDDMTGGINLDREEAAILHAAEWVSPLTVLFSPPCDRATWVFDDDRDYLCHLVCDPKIVEGKVEKDKNAQSLFSDEPPVEALYRSVLRFTFFQPLQTTMSKGKANGKFTTFKAVADHFTQIHKKLSTTLGYATRVLAEREKPVAAKAVVYQFPGTRRVVHERIAIAHSDEGLDPEDVDHLGSVIPEMLALDLGKGKTVGAALRAHTVNRKGLRVSDLAAHDGEDMYETGLEALLDLHGHLSHYLGWLSRQDLERCFEEDMVMFMPCLERLYEAGAERVAGADSE